MLIQLKLDAAQAVINDYIERGEVIPPYIYIEHAKLLVEQMMDEGILTYSDYLDLTK